MAEPRGSGPEPSGKQPAPGPCGSDVPDARTSALGSVLSTGGFNKRAVSPGQRTTLVAWGFDNDQDAIWVDHNRVPGRAVSGPDEQGRISFVVPEEVFNKIGKTVDLRIGPADKGECLADLPIRLTLQGPQWWQSRSCGFLLSTAIILFASLCLYRLSKLGLERPGAVLWLVDAQTNSYSLQRIQFLAWTVAGVFSYVYAFYALWIVQESHKYPDLPGTVVGVLGMSAGTSLLATAIRSVKGPEGAGTNQPAFWRDLITSGDVVALDKVQLVVWTVIGVLSFVWTVVSQEPLYLSDKMRDLPASLWQLAGLSGAIFVAGKAVRDPGPVISQVLVQEGEPAIIEIRGTNLSQDATFYLGNKEKQERIDIGRISGGAVVPEPASGLQTPALPRITVPGNTATARMVRGLHLKVKGMTSLREAQSFIIENPDGQRAECPYTLQKAT